MTAGACPEPTTWNGGPVDLEDEPEREDDDMLSMTMLRAIAGLVREALPGSGMTVQTHPTIELVEELEALGGKTQALEIEGRDGAWFDGCELTIEGVRFSFLGPRRMTKERYTLASEADPEAVAGPGGTIPSPSSLDGEVEPAPLEDGGFAPHEWSDEAVTALRDAQARGAPSGEAMKAALDAQLAVQREGLERISGGGLVRTTDADLFSAEAARKFAEDDDIPF